MTRVLGSRATTAGIVEVRRALLDAAGRRPTRMGILTAYFGPESFEFLEELYDRGASALDLILSANGSSKAAWRSARDFAMRRLTGVNVRLVGSGPGTLLHSKMILVNEPTNTSTIVGSSNFTAGGLWANVEINVELSEREPLTGGSPVKVLSDYFDDVFAVAAPASSSLFESLILAAPERTRSGSGLPAGAAGPTVPVYGSSIPVVSTGAIAPALPGGVAPTAAGGYNTLLFQLTAADAERPVWGGTGVGTSELNLPRDGIAILNLPTGSGLIPVDAIGTGRLAGTVTRLEAGLWQRAPRRPGAQPETIRLRFPGPLGEFIMDDLGRRPRENDDVFVLEAPASGVDPANPVRIGVIPLAEARRLGLEPTGNSRGVPPLARWEPRLGTVL